MKKLNRDRINRAHSAVSLALVKVDAIYGSKTPSDFVREMATEGRNHLLDAKARLEELLA